jgi:hypothetical protein
LAVQSAAPPVISIPPESRHIRAWAGVQASAEDIANLRKNALAIGERSLPANLLKYADDQAAVAVAAVCRAIADFGLENADFTEWGVVGAPRYLGRTAIAAACNQFQRHGASTVSPLIIPYLSQHVISGTISLALGAHGPNLGSGGGEQSITDAFMTVLALDPDQRLPGIWLVLTQWHPEPEPDDSGHSPLEGVCQAVALALTPGNADLPGLCLRFVLSSAPAAQPCRGLEQPSVGDIISFLKALGTERAPDSLIYALVGGGHFELEAASAARMIAPRVKTDSTLAA